MQVVLNPTTIRSRQPPTINDNGKYKKKMWHWNNPITQFMEANVKHKKTILECITISGNNYRTKFPISLYIPLCQKQRHFVQLTSMSCISTNTGKVNLQLTSNYMQFGSSLSDIGTDTKRLWSELGKFPFLAFLLNSIGMFGHFVRSLL